MAKARNLQIWSNEQYSLKAYANELFRVLHFVSKRHSSSKICLLGHSWGGQIVLELLLEETFKQELQEMVTWAVVSNTPLDEQSYQSKQIYMRSQLDALTRQYYEEEEAAKLLDGSIGSLIYRRLIGESETCISGEMKNWSVLTPPRRLENLPLPCLFITGTDDTVPLEEYNRLQELVCDRCRVVVLDGAGHGPFYDSPETYFEAIQKFMQSFDCAL